MSQPRNTSRTFEAMRQAKKLLTGAAWQARPGSNTLRPFVDYTSQADHTANSEHVLVSVDPEAAIIDWITSPSGREETFVLLVTIRTGEWRDTDDAFDRLEELADTAQRAFYRDNSDGLPVPNRLDLGTNSVELGGLVSVEPGVYREPNYCVGVCEIRYQVVAHI